jgi:pimeloyl-ACP methyl ester carboxylesterase
MGGGDRLLDHYDIVGFDPRGVGQSTPVECGTDAELDDYFLRDEIISTEAELTAAIEQTADFAERCRELTGALIENVDTASAARDMDVIRAVLGEERLNFLGMSYGTQLGAVYAALFPENVGRMVLDGAFDFLLPSEDISMGQARGFEQALEAYIADCLTSEDCPLPQDPELARRTIQEMLDTARDEGIPSYRGDVNGTVLLYGIFVPLYIGETWWPDLSDSIAEYLDRGTAREFQYLSDTFYIGRDEEGHYLDNTQEAFTAISCLDTPSSPEVSITEFRDFRRDAEEASPTFGWWFGSNTGCEGWPFTPDEIVTDLTPTASAPPIVVIGTTGDPATPVEWAESLAERMPTASLVIYTGEGHLAYLTANPCIVDAVDSYFVDDTVPASGLTC